MKFCEKCGCILVSKKENNKTFLVCRKCGFKIEYNHSIQIKEEIKKNPMDEVVVLDKQNEALPKIKVFCPKCGHNEAVWWIRQTRSADEAPTTFYRCTKCKYSWREYG